MSEDKSLNELLVELHKASVKNLLDKIKNDEASAAELGRAIELLKHNGITADGSDEHTKSLKDALGEFDLDAFNEANFTN